MRKFLIPLAVAGSALAVATPAAAQWAPAPQPYAHPYGQPYGQAYGYQNHYGHARALQARVDRLQRELGRLAQYRMISRNEYQNRQHDAREIERRLRREARDGRGLNVREMYSVERRIARLEQKIARDVRDGRRYAWRW
jgi:hypothetical protein